MITTTLLPRCRRWVLGLLIFAFTVSLLLSGQRVFAQGTTALVVHNPVLEADCGLDVILILDESFSIFFAGVDDVRKGALAFLGALSDTGSRVAVVKFSQEAEGLSNGNSDERFIAVTPETMRDLFVPYINTGYAPSFLTSATNWQAALIKANDLNEEHIRDTGVPVPLVVFVTDGNANRPGDEKTAMESAVQEANTLKHSASHIFVVGVGHDTAGSSFFLEFVDENNLRQISGDRRFPDLEGDLRKADYTLIGFDEVSDSLGRIAFELCAPSLSVTKLIEPGGEPESGWTFEAEVGVPRPNGIDYRWLEPDATVNPGGRVSATTDENGRVLFQWAPDDPEKRSRIAVTERVKPGFSDAVQVRCEVKNRVDPNPQALGLTVDGATFEAELGPDDIATCEVRNQRISTPIHMEKEIFDGATFVDADTLARAPRIAVGQDAVYRLRVRNSGPGELTELVVQDPDLGLRFPVPAGLYPDGDGVLRPGQEIVLTEAVIPQLRRPCQAPGPLENEAKVTARAATQPVTNRDTAWLDCVPVANRLKLDLGIRGADSIPAGERLIYTVELRNNGSVTATDIQVDVEVGLPAGFEITAQPEPSRGAWRGSVWTIPILAGGEFATLGFSLTTTPSPLCAPGGAPEVTLTAELTDAKQPLLGHPLRVSRQTNVAEPATPFICTDRLSSGVVNLAYESGMRAVGGKKPLTWEVKGELPTGLSFSTGGFLNGKPEKRGSFSFAVRVRDDAGKVADGVVGLQVASEGLVVLTADLEDACLGEPYQAPILVDGGRGSHTCTLASGELPDGLELDAECASGIRGIPAEEGRFELTVEARDEVGQARESGPLQFRTVDCFRPICDPSEPVRLPRISPRGPGPGFPNETLQQAAVDRLGNRYLVGFGYNGSNYDIWLRKYRRDEGSPGAGNELVWQRSFNSGGDSRHDGHDYGYAVTVGPDQSIYAGGYRLKGNEFQAVVLKYSFVGVLQWQRAFTLGRQTNAFYDLVADADGVYAVGEHFNGRDFDALIVKYTHDGSESWHKRLRRGGDDSVAYQVRMVPCQGKSGCPFTLVVAGAEGDAWDRGWISRLNPRNADVDEPTQRQFDFPVEGLALFSGGDMVIGGADVDRGWRILRLDNSLGNVWLEPVRFGPGDGLRSMQVDSQGFVYAAGYGAGANGDDGLILVLSPDGESVDCNRADEGGSFFRFDNGASERFHAVVLGQGGSLSAAGQSCEDSACSTVNSLLLFNVDRF